MLWVLMLAFPFPYIATTAGWMTAELGRQPWLVYGLMRTADGTRRTVSAGNVALHARWDSAGLYLVLGMLFLYSCTSRTRDRTAGPAARRRAGKASRWKRSGSRIVAVMLAVYVVLDGFDFGAGILHLFVARTDEERRTVLARHRPGLGRQRGLAHRRRGRAVHGLPAASTPRGSAASTCR